MVRVKSPQDFGASIIFILIGVAGLYFGSELSFGSAARMGPGYFPMIVSGLPWCASSMQESKRSCGLPFSTPTSPPSLMRRRAKPVSTYS